MTEKKFVERIAEFTSAIWQIHALEHLNYADYSDGVVPIMEYLDDIQKLVKEDTRESK